ncbi:hypothetical protein RND71_032516 [Anisodus tanguticus]|uniref:Zinc finger, CCHC-type n=1 Tax=Anisodus tanguticus TaxID=243964 RepID=A0AAE1UWN5_9SOLA|nr:hypothetical protein RND71_032516 [Anisodus tanguticus]
MEAEFLALGAKQQRSRVAEKYVIGYKVVATTDAAISLHRDSEATLSRAYNKIYNGKSRHIGLRHAYVRQLISDGIVIVIYVRSCNNLRDPFTKGLPREMIYGTSQEMGLRPV